MFTSSIFFFQLALALYTLYNKNTPNIMAKEQRPREPKKQKTGEAGKQKAANPKKQKSHGPKAGASYHVYSEVDKGIAKEEVERGLGAKAIYKKYVAPQYILQATPLRAQRGLQSLRRWEA